MNQFKLPGPFFKLMVMNECRMNDVNDVFTHGFSNCVV